MVVGWVVVWNYAQKFNLAAEQELKVNGKPDPIVADKSIEFETVTDRTPLGFRDNAAYSMLLARARARTPDELAALARRDIVVAHLWQNPQLYRGVPVHLLGTALRILRHQSKLSPSGWLYEAWIITPDATRLPYVCVFDEPPEGLPIGGDVSERVVFNGYFLKIMKYNADTARGAPVLVGRIGWTPGEPAPKPGENSLLRWTLIILGILFFASLLRWVFQLRKFLNPPRRSFLSATTPVNETIDPVGLDAWVKSVLPPEEAVAPHPGATAQE